MPFDSLKICLITDSSTIDSAVRLSCSEPTELLVYPMATILDENNAISDDGHSLIDAASISNVVLIHWSMDRAPLIGTLCYRIRKRADVFLVAVCGAGQEEIIGALSSGVDDVISFPLYMPLLHAKIVAYDRMVRFVRKSALKKFRKKLKRELVRSVENSSELTNRSLGDISDRLFRSNGAKLSEASEQVVSAVVEKTVVDVVDEITATVMVDPSESNGKDAGGAHKSGSESLKAGSLSLDLSARRFYVKDEEVELTPKEFDLVNYLMNNVDRACTRDEILEHVWGINFETGTNMVDVYMHFLRKKLEARGTKGLIKTIRGHGYRLSPR